MRYHHTIPKKRLLLSGAIITTMTLSLAACSGGVGKPVSSKSAAAQKNAGKVLKLAHVYDKSHPVSTCGVNTLQKRVKGDGLTIKEYPSGQLGSEAEALEQVKKGGLDLAIAGPSYLGEYHKPLQVLDAAYLFDDLNDFNKGYHTSTVQELFKQLKTKSGIKVLSSWYYGTRHVTANKPIKSPEDMKGLKVRVPDAPLYLINTRAMGGKGTPMTLDEVYEGLQQGAIDAEENPIPTIKSSKFDEVQKYLNMTAHVVQSVEVTTNDKLYRSLSDKQQKALDDGLKDAAAKEQQCVRKQEKSIVKKWQNGHGIKVNNDIDKKAFEKRARERIPDNKKVSWGPLYKKLQSS